MEKRAASQLVRRRSGDVSKTERLGVYELESLLTPEEENRASVYRVSMRPNQRSRESYHRVAEEFYFVLSGRGKAIIDRQEYDLQLGDFLRLPAGTRHLFVSGEEGLDFLNIHVPGCRPDHDTYFAE